MTGADILCVTNGNCVDMYNEQDNADTRSDTYRQVVIHMVAMQIAEPLTRYGGR